jgi:hypothetical protein
MLDDTRRREADQPAELLREAHLTGRHHCDVALALAEREDADARWVARTAEQLSQFFGEELAAHDAEEDQLIGRALVAHDRSVATTLGLLATQHAMLRDAAHELVGLWQKLAQRPTTLPEFRERLVAATTRMVAMLESHLELEETLLPRLAALPEPVRRAICAKMHERRARR